jgi:macrolide-specific efflux system membrane fusion protein
MHAMSLERPRASSASSFSRWRFRLGMAFVLVSLAVLLWHGFFRTVEVVDTEPIRRGSIENTVSALGVLQPHRYVDVGAQVSGQVKRIAVPVGGTVKQGDFLLEIDPALQQATVSANRATLAGLRASAPNRRLYVTSREDRPHGSGE